MAYSGTGYSSTPLAKKLGIKPNHRVALVGAVPGFTSLLEPMPPGVELLQRARNPVDVVICFCPDDKSLRRRLPRARRLLDPDGGLWIAWPKKSSGVTTDLSFEVVQPAGLALGLVDNKVCAVDEVWSGLRFVHRLEDRPALREQRA